MEGHPLPQPGPRRRGAADPAPQRLQDRRADRARPQQRRGHRGAPRAVTGYDADLRRGRRPGGGPPGASPRRSTGAHAAIREIQQDGADRRRRQRPATLAGDRAAHAEGLDRPARRRRRAGRGHVPRPPGAARRRAGQPRAPRACSRSGCDATGPRSCSTPTAASSRSSPRSRPTGDRRMGATPHANGGRPACGRSILPTRDVRASRSTPPGDAAVTSPPGRSGELLRDIYAAAPRPTAAQLPALLPGRDQLATGSAPCSRSRPLLGQAASLRHRRPPRPPTAG